MRLEQFEQVLLRGRNTLRRKAEQQRGLAAKLTEPGTTTKQRVCYMRLFDVATALGFAANRAVSEGPYTVEVLEQTGVFLSDMAASMVASTPPHARRHGLIAPTHRQLLATFWHAFNVQFEGPATNQTDYEGLFSMVGRVRQSSTRPVQRTVTKHYGVEVAHGLQ